MTNGLPPKAVIDRLRAQYPLGCRVELVSMDDPYSTLKPGDQGTVTSIDDIGTIFVRWETAPDLARPMAQTG